MTRIARLILLVVAAAASAGCAMWGEESDPTRDWSAQRLYDTAKRQSGPRCVRGGDRLLRQARGQVSVRPAGDAGPARSHLRLLQVRQAGRGACRRGPVHQAPSAPPERRLRLLPEGARAFRPRKFPPWTDSSPRTTRSTMRALRCNRSAHSRSWSSGFPRAATARIRGSGCCI